MRKSIFFLLLLTPALVSNTVRADETPRTGVVDRAGVMRPTEIRQLNEWLLELEQKTGAQLKVLIVPTTGGQDIYQFSIDTARRWRLGQKGKNNGALVVVATQDRKWHVQTGEGVEAALPDILVDQIAQQNFVPNFRKGEYSRGIFLGTTELARAIAKDSGVELGGLPAQQVQRGSRTQRNRSGVRRDGGAGSSCCVMVLPFIVLILVFGSIAASARRMNRGAWGHGRRGRFSPGSFVAGMLLNNMLGGRRGGGGWSSGGSSRGGGGGGGGFGGGGGGSFGGGGAGGSW